MRARRYPSDPFDCQWALAAPHIPPAAPGGRPRSTCMRAVLDPPLYLLRTGCQWRQLPADFPPWPTVHGYFRRWRRSGILSRLRRILHQQARVAAGRRPWPTVAIMDAQSAKTTGCGGVRGFDGYRAGEGAQAPHPRRHARPAAFPSACSRPMRRTSGGASLLAGLPLRWPTSGSSSPMAATRDAPWRRAVSTRGRGIGDCSARRPSLLSRDRPHRDCRAYLHLAGRQRAAR